MNDNLKNYTEQPDAEVWQKIDGEMRKGRVRRQTIGAAAGVLLVAAAAVLMLRPAAPAAPQAPAEDEPAVAMVQPEVKAAAEQVAAAAEQPVQQRREQQTAEQPQCIAAAPAAQNTAAEPAQPEARQSAAAPTAAPAAAQQPVRTAQPAAAAEPAVRPAAQPAATAEPVAAQQQPSVKSPVSGKVEDTILWVPNVFVPGSDDPEVNSFRVRLNKPNEYVSNFKMSIFNRSGHQVYHSNDISAGWDGTYNGQALQQASYVYIIYYTDKDRVQHQRKGTVTLIR